MVRGVAGMGYGSGCCWDGLWIEDERVGGVCRNVFEELFLVTVNSGAAARQRLMFALACIC